MDRKSTKNLRLDQRLAGRRNWIAPADLEKELDALPDVSHKIAEPEEEPESSPETEASQDSDSSVSDGLDLSSPTFPGT